MNILSSPTYAQEMCRIVAKINSIRRGGPAMKTAALSGKARRLR
jgi:hypothetical protein